MLSPSYSLSSLVNASSLASSKARVYSPITARSPRSSLAMLSKTSVFVRMLLKLVSSIKSLFLYMSSSLASDSGSCSRIDINFKLSTNCVYLAPRNCYSLCTLSILFSSNSACCSSVQLPCYLSALMAYLQLWKRVKNFLKPFSLSIHFLTQSSSSSAKS